jgi:uncharacterized protein
MTTFLHGVETIRLKKGSKSVKVVKSAVIGIVGIAPLGDRQSLVVVNTEKDAAAFGSQIPGFTIPQALDAILTQGNATIVVVNVFDPAVHLATVSGETKTVVGGKLKLAYAPISNLVITNSVPQTLVKDTDFTIDDFGNVQILNFTKAAEGSTLTIGYKRLDPSTVTASLIVGAIDGTTNVRTGSKLFEECYNRFGFKPKLLIAPGFITTNSVATAFIALAEKYRGIALIDAPIGTTVPNAITGRGPSGTINFNTSIKRAYLLYPALKANSPATNLDENRPYSQFMAGVISRVDNEEGYWNSPSNKPIFGVSGPEIAISAAINDATTESNQLNEVGITTVFNSFGTGLRTWGNRTAAWPSSTDIDQFLPVLRTVDIIDESIELAMLQFIDSPITQATIDAVRDTANAFIRTLIGRGALIPGSVVKFNADDNSPEQLAAGHVVFEKVLCPPPPMERMTFNTVIDISLLKNLIK